MTAPQLPREGFLFLVVNNASPLCAWNGPTGFLTLPGEPKPVSSRPGRRSYASTELTWVY